MRAGPRPAALAALLLLAAAPARAEEPRPPAAPVALDVPFTVAGLLVEDGDGDGIPDLFVVKGREVRGWRGARGTGPAPAPTWTFQVPPEATFVDVGRAIGEGDARSASLLALATTGVLRLMPGKPPVVEEGVDARADWADPYTAVFADLVRGPGVLLPSAGGLSWIPDLVAARSRVVPLAVPPRRTLAAPGPFLGDQSEIVEAWPEPIVRPAWAAAGGRDGAIVLGPDGVHALLVAREGEPARDVLYPTSFLPAGTERRLVDFDADGVPDLATETTTNMDGKYGFFRIPAPDAAAAAPRDVRPARGLIRLSGFQLPPEHPDLDGDGRPDFVVTTIEIDAKNLLRALNGAVTARTRAFLNRSKAATGATDLWFPAVPDAEIESDVGVRILFSFTGSIEVRRSFTIVPGGDLDGDGRKDLLIRTSRDAFSVWRGAGSGVWGGEPRRLAIPPMGDSPEVEARAADLSGDGRDDLVLLYRGAPGASDRVFVLVSP